MELANAVVYLKNRSPTSAVATTPYELWNGVKPNLTHLRILGSAAYIHVPKEKRTKLDTHSHKGDLVGYGGTNVKEMSNFWLGNWSIPQIKQELEFAGFYLASLECYWKFIFKP